VPRRRCCVPRVSTSRCGGVTVAIPLFPRFTALDAVGLYEVLQRIPSFDFVFIGKERGQYRSENGMIADATFAELAEPDVMVFPGGVGTWALQHDEQVLDWVRHAHEYTRFTTSVCTGSLVLGAAGPLEGLTATTRWSCYPELAAHGALPTAERVVHHPNRRIMPACRAGSTWPYGWSRSWSTARPQKRRN
jgi:putative intracellular protease/amidase